MKQYYIICSILLVLLININKSLAQTDTVFWFAVPYATTGHDAALANYYADLTITAKDTMVDTYIKISQPGDPLNILLPIYDTIFKRDIVTNPSPNFTKNINIPRALLTTISNNLYNNVQKSALLIQSNRPINAYYEYHRSNFNPDIFTLKGDNALGIDFWVPFQTTWNNYTSRNPAAMSQIVIVATKNGTQVQVTFTKDAQGYPIGGPYTINLQKGQTYMFVPKERVASRPNEAGAAHLSGTHITSNYPIAVTIGDDSAIKNSPNDYIGDQLVPVKNIKGKNTIGYEYVVMKGQLNNTGGNERVFVLATQNTTNITYTIKGDAAVVLPAINAGAQAIINLMDVAGDDFVYISADKPVVVFHVSGFGEEMGGAIVPTIDGCTGSKDVGFVRSKNQGYYLNIMTHFKGLNYFKLSTDNGPLNPYFTAADFEYTGVGDLYVLRQGINNKTGDLVNFPVQKTLRLTNDSSVFHLGTINGIGSGGGCAYGYFSDYTFFDVKGRIVESNTPILSSCYGNPIQLEVTAGHNSYEWSSPETPASVTYLDNPFIYNPSAELPAGIHKFQVRVKGDCSLDTIVKGFVVEIFPAVDAKFTILPSSVGCAPYTIQIQNLSTVADKFRWDFENDRIWDDFTTTPAPHTYYNSLVPYKDSVYTLRLLAIKDTTDCADEYIRYVRVHPEIYAGFTQDKLIGCNPLDVVFTNTSIGNLDKYLWDFDGTSTSLIASPTHRYVNDNPNDTAFYSTKMKVTSPFLCSDSIVRTFTVFPYIKGEFTIDTAYGCSPLPVTITNISAGADSVIIDFGDGLPTLNTSSMLSVIHTYRNTGTTVLKRPVELRALNDEGCVKIWRDTITVYPEIQATYTVDVPSYTGCNTQLFNFVNTTLQGPPDIANSFLWTFGDGSNLSTSNVNVPKTYTNTFNKDTTYTFNLHAESQYGCFDDTSRTIRIYRAKADYVIDTTMGCSPLKVNFVNTSVGNDITAWAWEFGQGPDSGVKDPLTKTYTNTSGGTIIPNLRLTVTGTGGCSTFKEVPVSVYSSVDIAFTPLLPVVCDSVQIPFITNLIHGTVASYNWTFGDGTSSGAMNPVKTYRNLLSPTDTTYTAKLKALTAQGCADSMSTVVTVRPYVNALFTIDSVSGCTPLTVNPVATTYMGIPAANYLWTLNGALIHTGFDPSPYLLPVNPAPGPEANYKLRLSVSNLGGYCPDFMEKDIDVYPAALANFTPKEVSGCNSFVVDFLSTSSINSTSFLWDFGDLTTFYGDNPLPKSFSNASDFTKTYKIKLKATTDYGCTHTDSANIYVHPFVKADFAVDISKDCSPLEVTITNNSRGGTYRWYWDSQTGTGPYDTTTTNASGVFKHKYINTTSGDKTFYLTVVAENDSACTKLFTRPILVHSSIVAGFTYSQPDSCNQSDVRFTNTSTGGNSYTMNWNFGDGTSLATTTSPVDKKFINNTTNDVPYTVVMTAESENGCKDSFTDTVRVYSRVEANFSIPISRGCPNAVTTNFDANIINTSIGNVANTYQWYVDNVPIGVPTNKDPFFYSYQNNTPAVRKYGVRLEAKNPHGCISQKSDTVTVYEYVDANFVAVNPAGCSPLTVNFTNSSSAPATNTNYLWEYGDNTSSQSFSPPHLFVNESRTADKPFRILLTVTSENHCKDTISRAIMVYHKPLAKLYVSETADCPPLVGTMNNNNSRGYTKYEWDYGDGSPVITVNSTIPETRPYSYPNPSIDVIYNYWVKLYVESNQGCWHRDSSKLVVFPDVIADFTYDLAGCSPFVAEFKNTSSTPATRFLWDFKDGSTDNNATVLHRFVNDTELDVTLNVSLTATSDYDCWDIISKPVTIYAQPKAFYNPLPSVQIFPENRVHLNSTSNNKPWNYLWTFDDGLTSTDANVIFHDYEHWGERNINLRLQSKTSSCFDTLTKKIVIYPPAINAAFTTNVSEGCLNTGFEVDFTAAASAYSEVYTYEWEFGDGSATQYGQNISHTYTKAGVYYVKLTASGESGEDYEYKTIRVYSNPKANFEVSPKVVMLNTDLEARVEFFNLSECNDTSGCSYLWDFGNGKTSIARDVTHNYTPTPDEVPIKYDISLYVTTAHGCRDSLILIEEVEIIGAGQIEFPNAFTPNGDGLNDTFRPVSEGVIQYDLLLYNRWGELIFKTNDLSVGWNGTIKGNDAKPDVYVWKAQGKFSNGRAFEMAGDVTLIR